MLNESVANNHLGGGHSFHFRPGYTVSDIRIHITSNLAATVFGEAWKVRGGAEPKQTKVKILELLLCREERS